ncbi:MAG TPA: hypothetical protein VIF62_24110 [Labilithrix sp.]
MRRALVAAILLVSCSSKPSATIALVTGGEPDALTRTPVPTTIVVEQVNPDATTKELVRTSLPTDDFDLGDFGQDDYGAIRVQLLDPTGKPIVRGESLFVQFSGLADTTFDIFVQRSGELARVPSPPTVSLDAPVVDVVLGRYIFATGGTTATLYDLLLNQALTNTPVLPRAAVSLANYGTVSVVIDEQGATILDLSDGTTEEQAAPASSSWGEVAGGATIYANDGSAYVVGGTRIGHGGPSTRVMHIDANGTLTGISLATPREGACAAFVPGRGLIVYGGTADGPGAEVLAPDALQGTELAYPMDPVRACGLATLDGNHVLVAGGSTPTGTMPAPPRALDLACTAGCMPTPWAGTVPLVRAQGFGLAPDAALFVGDDDMGNTHAFRFSVMEQHEVPLRVARKGARLVALPNGAAAVVGGAADIETYRE